MIEKGKRSLPFISHKKKTERRITVNVALSNQSIYYAWVTSFTALVNYLFGSWHVSLGVLFTFMALDILTGIAKGASTSGVRSRVMMYGLFRKAGILVVIIIANMMDKMLGNDMPIFRTIVVGFYVAVEGISITENLMLLGVPVPQFIIQYLEHYKEAQEQKGDELSKKRL
ncbi:phage holin family protein [Bacillus wiedmannii]|uniref:phage holin family protein n=1 Tax=Bacillus wiedmannii TaxID=1890302 RepID=UPI003D248A88